MPNFGDPYSSIRTGKIEISRSWSEDFDFNDDPDDHLWMEQDVELELNYDSALGYRPALR
jgi:hypothetical protein